MYNTTFIISLGLQRKRLTAGNAGLILTAKTELRVVKHTFSASSLGPATARSQIPELALLIPPLLSAIENQSPNADVFQCQTCLAWIHWLLSEPGLAASRLPENIMSLFLEISKVQNPSLDYTTVCMLRSIYMKASYLNQEGDVFGSLEQFQTVVPWMHEHESKLLSRPPLLFWSQQILAHMALTASDGVDVSSEPNKRISTALQAFRHWAIFSASGEAPARDELQIARPVRRKAETWKAYYSFLSKVLRHGSDHSMLGEKRTRLHQAAELRQIESIYEKELLRVTRFPSAHESNRVIEEWVEQVIQNWKLLCGGSWPEADLGEGGHNAVGRHVLDILYRAATKTFHSTLILRCLFQVHKSLAEFSLAYKAIDAYLELVSRGKNKDQKSHQRLRALDDDETVMSIISEGIEGLCTSGRKDEAENAFELTRKLEQWVEDYSSRQPDVQSNRVTGSRSDAQTLETVYRAIGIGKAFWATWTPVSEQRSMYQSDALETFRQATAVLPDTPPSLETAYAQALLLSETRDLKGAIDCVKSALSTSGPQAAKSDFAQQRRLMPFWHLLALLTSARQEFDTAYQMCGAAFGHFSGSNVLFVNQSASLNGSTNTNKQKTQLDDGMQGLVDELNVRERERMVEIRMTELAVIELVEGPEEAVNVSNELLSLFSRLFGHLGIGKEERSTIKEMIPPKSSAGTVKSLRGSIFGRKRHEPSISTQTQGTNGVSSLPENNLARYSTNTTEAPTIQVTDEDSRTEKQESHFFRRSHSHNRDGSQSRKYHKREGSKAGIFHRHSRSAAKRSISSVRSSQRQSFETGHERLSESGSTVGGATKDVSENSTIEQVGLSHPEDNLLIPNAPLLHLQNKVPEAKVPLPPIAHNFDHKDLPPPAGHGKQPPEQDVRLPVIHPSTTSTQPSPLFPQAAEEIHARGVLVKVWLLVAGLYRRASLFEDSLEACDEASRSASEIEALLAAQESSAAAFSDPGWGGGKSLNEIWADVMAERAYLALIKGMPHEAIKQFEEALMYSLDHPKAIVGLSNILLDIYEQKIPSEPPRPGLDLGEPEKQKQDQARSLKLQDGPLVEEGPAAPRAGDELRKTPENLNRLAARDRAYGLLSNLTKLGTSWDDSDAWYALARAHECSGQIEKAKEVLWWCVELEDTRPVRHWRNIGTGSYVL